MEFACPPPAPLPLPLAPTRSRALAPTAAANRSIGRACAAAALHVAPDPYGAVVRRRRIAATPPPRTLPRSRRVRGPGG